MIKKSKTLVIKPTYRCDYDCEFCSTIGDNSITLDSGVLLDFIGRMSEKYVLSTVVSGGEPLIVGTDYIQSILDSPVTAVGIQSNGEIAYNNLDTWLPLLKHQKMRFGISFQLGSQRKNKAGVVFTKEKYFKFQERFKQNLGYYLFFIYVITNDNLEFDKIDEMVEIARYFDISFRVSAVFKNGRGRNVYIPQYKSIRIFNYLLEKYPEKSLQIFPLKDFLLTDRPLGSCNYTPDCTKGMLGIEPNGDIYTCEGLGDRHLTPIGHISDDIETLEENINKVDLSHQIRDECSSCHLKNFCNSCYIRYLDIIEDREEDKDRYCSEMKKLLFNIGEIRLTLGLEPDIIEVYKKNRQEKVK